MASGHHLYLMRHLPTAGNQLKQYIGWKDEPIIALKKSFQNKSLPVSGVVHGSDLLRAKETALLIWPDALYHADARLRECHFGQFEGKTYAELEKDKDYRKWLDNMETVAPPGGESLVDVERRVLEGLISLPDGAIAVTHGGPIRIALTKFSPEPKEFWSWKIPHGSMWKFEWQNLKDLKEGKRCVSLSEVPITGKGIM